VPSSFGPQIMMRFLSVIASSPADRFAPLIDLDPDRLDDGAPFIDFRFEESLKLTRGSC